MLFQDLVDLIKTSTVIDTYHLEVLESSHLIRGYSPDRSFRILLRGNRLEGTFWSYSTEWILHMVTALLNLGKRYRVDTCIEVELSLGV